MGILSFFEEFYRLDTELFDKKNSRFIYLFILSFAIFSFNLVPVNAILAIILFLFVIAPLRACFFMFVFYTLWEYVTVFSNGITLNLLFQIVLFVKILLFKEGLKLGLKHKLAPISLFWLYYTFIYGIFCALTENGFTGFNIFFKSLFFIYALSYMTDNEGCNMFWKTILMLIAISTLFSVVYGHFYDTAVQRWVTGLEGGYGTQLYGTLGTTRTGLFTVASIIYLLYYIKNIYLKIGFSFIYIIFTFMTISITAFLLLLGIFFIYFYSRGFLKGKRIITFIVAASFIAILFFPHISQMDVMRPLFLRVEKIEEQIKLGDINNATSGREDLASYYVQELEQGSNLELFFGRFHTSALSAVNNSDANSHNSYIDMLFYFGFIGIVLLVFVSVKKIIFVKRLDCFYPVLSLKIIFLLVATSVSIFSSTYWLFFTLL